MFADVFLEQMDIRCMGKQFYDGLAWKSKALNNCM
jgi:hypothetical protein